MEFTDTGIGIDPAIQDRIFEPFYQGDADVRRRPEGLGLGLAISRSIAEAHGGRLSLQSPGPGQGSTFRLELATVPAEATTSPEPITPPSIPPGRSGLNVLLVEDNQETLRYLTLMLKKRNYNVVPVDRVSAALAAAGEAQFDLLISDIELPDGTGLELIHGLGGGRTLPGIAISGFGSEEDLQQSAGAGFAEHLTKPIDLNRLESAIRRVTSPVIAPPRRGRFGFARGKRELRLPGRFELRPSTAPVGGMPVNGPHGCGSAGGRSGFFSAVRMITPRSSGSSLRPPGIAGTITSWRVVASTSCPRPP